MADDLGLSAQGQSVDLKMSVVDSKCNLIKEWCSAHKLNLNSDKNNRPVIHLSIVKLKSLGTGSLRLYASFFNPNSSCATSFMIAKVA